MIRHSIKEEGNPKVSGDYYVGFYPHGYEKKPIEFVLDKAYFDAEKQEWIPKGSIGKMCESEHEGSFQKSITSWVD